MCSHVPCGFTCIDDHVSLRCEFLGSLYSSLQDQEHFKVRPQRQTSSKPSGQQGCVLGMTASEVERTGPAVQACKLCKLLKNQVRCKALVQAY